MGLHLPGLPRDRRLTLHEEWVSRDAGAAVAHVGVASSMRSTAVCAGGRGQWHMPMNASSE